MTLAFRYAARTDVGLIRDGNEDSGYAGPNLLAVADGMGGAVAGELASAITIETVRQYDSADLDDPVGVLSEAASTANGRILARIKADPRLDGMGTTLTAGVLYDDRILGVIHIGDSRAYLLRDGELKQLTHDHTFVQSLVDEGKLTPQQAEHHPHRSLIIRVLDGHHEVQLDVDRIELQAGDWLLFCSDGLGNADIRDSMIASAMIEAETPEAAALELIRKALRAGSPDNVTCVVAEVVDLEELGISPDRASVFLGSQPTVVGAAAEPDLDIDQELDQDEADGDAKASAASAEAADADVGDQGDTVDPSGEPAEEAFEEAAGESVEAPAEASPEAPANGVTVAAAEAPSAKIADKDAAKPGDEIAAKAVDGSADESVDNAGDEAGVESGDPSAGASTDGESAAEGAADGNVDGDVDKVVDGNVDGNVDDPPDTIVGENVDGNVDETVDSSAADSADADKQVDAEADSPSGPAKRSGKGVRLVLAAMVLSIVGVLALAGARFAFNWTQQKYYIGSYPSSAGSSSDTSADAHDEHVAIFRGVNQRVPGIQLSSVLKVEQITLDELPANHQRRVEETISVNDLDQAVKLVSELRQIADGSGSSTSTTPVGDR
ncbi:PP2C family protein-serine/threonine phosphatase [Flindersiella endophytica]